VSVDEVRTQTGFELHAEDVSTTRLPTDAELELLAELDPKGLRGKEVPDA
jgi:hypothetical protein